MHRLLLVCLCVCWCLMASLGCKEELCSSNDDCESGTYCKVLEGKCVSDCTADTNCPPGEECKEGKCKKKAENCEPKKQKQCVGSQLYWFDSCGYQEELIEDCGKSGCVDDRCSKNTKHCGNGSCEPGLEDCLTCAEDCKCQPGETCDGGACKANSSCGNGTCDKDKSEDCASCAKDCACASGKICKQSQCEDQASCGNGTCEAAEGENCLSCPRDCSCQTGQSCNAGSCQDACGDGKCDTVGGENCSTCAKDCPCGSGLSCKQGICEKSCGNARCESSYGENCSTCAKDCACAAGQPCNAGSCGADCGNGTCQADKGENCSTCAKDCACKSDETCNSGKCSSRCGNGVCDKAEGEGCGSCAKDCPCQQGFSCNGGSCTSPCGDGKCDKDKGENCSTCAKDCGCGGKPCVNGSCSCTPKCDGKSCGDDGCGGSCGTCSGRATCASGKCECAHECSKQGEAKCVDAQKYERCDVDSSGCRFRKTFTCVGGKPCTNGSCCASACAGKTCGDDGCGGSCGACAAGQICKSGKCECNNECAKVGDTKCDGTNGYRECIKDPTTGCLKLASKKACPSGVSCANGKCCQPLCSSRECGSDGCGGSCGTCTYGCQSNLCRRKFLVVSIDFPCGLCDDSGSIGSYVKPDPYIKLTLSNGQSFKTGDKGNTCGKVLTYSWSLDNLPASALKNAKIEVIDADPLNSDDFCAEWRGDFSKVGKRTINAASFKNAKVTIEVKR